MSDPRFSSVHPGLSNNAHPGYGQANAPGSGSQGFGAQSAGYGYGASGAQQWPQNMAVRPNQNSGSLLNFTNDRFIKGALIGAAAAYLLTNESVQRTLIKSAVRTWSLVQTGVEEVKERFHDAEAEIHAESNQDD
ncbi:YtxH domain-containing protein [Rhabdochromatium marinum]|uniref:YtxH domain-containing protein n=1 Tax=Rhabdochromatium marinum TaxID=48729 RepID=UPI001F5B36A4|nr:YtxH domain-containing protein [Rhabdochromatium marinum]